MVYHATLSPPFDEYNPGTVRQPYRTYGAPGKGRTMGKNMEHSKKYRLIGQQLIRSLPEFRDIKDNEIKIAYLSSEQEKKKGPKIVYADCHIVEDNYKWCCKYDFFIVVYEPNVVCFTQEQLKTLIRHELHHVGVNYGGKEIKYYIVPHDVEEFWDIINDVGLEWSEIDGDETAAGEFKTSTKQGRSKRARA